jgi:hypothetical protein
LIETACSEEQAMSQIAPWDSRNNAGPRDTLQDDLNAAYRKHFEALKATIEGICYCAGVDVKPDIEAFEFFKEGCDNAFEIDWEMASEAN